MQKCGTLYWPLIDIFSIIIDIAISIKQLLQLGGYLEVDTI